MPEILTESFCERCGTRYTFEATHQRVHLKGVKVLSRGLKNFVLSDDTSMDEAMAAARAETDREVTSQQLDAFHQTFNFCMSCRQYTCPNCWNEAEARCLSCAPNLGRDVLDAPFPEVAGSAAAFPGLTNGSNGHAHDAQLAELEGADAVADVDAVARLQALTSPAPVSDADATWAEAVAAAAIVESETVPSVEATAAVVDTPAPAIAEDDAVVAEDAGSNEAGGAPEASGEAAAAEPEAAEHDAASIAAAAALAALAAEAVTESEPKTDIRSKTSGQTAGLLGRFRPGQNLDSELAAYEEDRTAALAGDAATAPEGTAPAEPTTERVAEADLAPEVVAAEVVAAEPEPVTAEPESVTAEPTAAALEPETEPAAAAPEPVVADPAPIADVVVQPTWQRVAPDPGPEAPIVPPPTAPSSVPASATSDPASPPQWPTQPEWPTGSKANGLPFLGRPAAPQGGLEALWAASSQELSAPPQPVAGKTASGIQPCVSCGLSLSANARFCRRCGTLQGG